jgi:hypothetical protein
MNAPEIAIPKLPVLLRSRLPARDATLIGSVIVAGIAAAAAGTPFLWLGTPIVAGLLLLMSQRESLASTLSVDAGVAELPPKLHRAVAETLARLPEGDAARMLNAVVRPARALLSARESSFDAREEDATREYVAELVAGACDIALDLARIEEVAPTAISGGTDLAQRYQSARALLEQRLGDAAAALSALFAAGVEHGTPASDRVAQLVTELREEAKVRGEAKAELDALLAKGVAHGNEGGTAA